MKNKKNNDMHISIAAIISLLFIICSIIAGNFMYQPSIGASTGFVTLEVVAPAANQQQTTNSQTATTQVTGLVENNNENNKD